MRDNKQMFLGRD